MLGNIGSVEVLVIGVVVLLLFGSKKLNELAHGLGESSKEVKKLKKEFDKALNEELKDEPEKTEKPKEEEKEEAKEDENKKNENIHK